MSWIKVKDGYIRGDSVEYIRRSTYLYDNKYRLIFDLRNGDSAIYNEYDTREECENQIDKLVNFLIDERDLLRRCNPNWQGSGLLNRE